MDKPLTVTMATLMTAATIVSVSMGAVFGLGPQAGGREWWLTIALMALVVSRIWYDRLCNRPVSHPAKNPDAPSDPDSP